MRDYDKSRLRRVEVVLTGLMGQLDAGAVTCPHCGTTKARDGEKRAQWEALNAALTRVRKVIDWTPWAGGVAPGKANRESDRASEDDNGR